MFCSNQQGNLFPICELAVVGSYASGILYLTAQIRRCQHWTRAEYAFLFHEVSLPTHMSGYGRTISNKSWTNLRGFLRDWNKQFSDTEMTVEVKFSMFFHCLQFEI
jgi:hypothetical protein